MSVRIFFHHVPKTAGTTVCSTLRMNFRPDSVFDVRASTKAERFNHFRQVVGESKGQHLKLVIGYMPLDALSLWRNHCDVTAISVLRNPLDRVVSLLNDIYRREDHYLHGRMHNILSESGILGVLQPSFTHEISNEIVRYFNFGMSCSEKLKLEHLEAAKDNASRLFSIIGVTDKHDEFLYLLKQNRLIDTNFYIKKNVKKGPRLTFDEIAKKEICDINQLDMEFFKWVEERFINTLSRIPMLDKKIAHFRMYNRFFGVFNSSYKLLIYRLLKST